MLGKFSAIISSNIFLSPFSLSLLLMGPFGAFNVVPEVSYAVFFFFFLNFPPYILFCSSDFHHSVLQVPYPFFCLSCSAIDFF